MLAMMVSMGTGIALALTAVTAISNMQSTGDLCYLKLCWQGMRVQVQLELRIYHAEVVLPDDVLMLFAQCRRNHYIPCAA